MTIGHYQLSITHHAYTRFIQRVRYIKRHLLYERGLTALRTGRYRYGEGAIKLCGAWWGCTVKGKMVILTTCYGQRPDNMIVTRYKERMGLPGGGEHGIDGQAKNVRCGIPD
jgi:hypothetical protein